MNRYCIDCVYATLIFRDRGSPFWQCGNPEYVSFDFVDGAKIWPSCETARAVMCGVEEARGYLSKIPEAGLPTPNLRISESDGVALVSAAHPKQAWVKRVWFWIWDRLPWTNKLNEDSLEDIEIEVRRD